MLSSCKCMHRTMVIVQCNNVAVNLLISPLCPLRGYAHALLSSLACGLDNRGSLKVQDSASVRTACEWRGIGRCKAKDQEDLGRCCKRFHDPGCRWGSNNGMFCEALTPSSVGLCSPSTIRQRPRSWSMSQKGLLDVVDVCKPHQQFCARACRRQEQGGS